jgi:hypothetical protein
MNTEDGKLIEQQEQLDILVVICRFLDELQDRYSLNDFCPADIILSKNGDTLFAKVKDNDGNGEIILHRWKLEEFKDSKVY